MSLSRRLANLGKAIDSATTGHFLSKGDSDGLFETIQYTDLTGRPTVLDSANITAIVDSAYVQLRQTVAGSGGLDSAAVTTLVDSAYVSARSPAAASGFAAYEYNTSAAQTTFQDSDVNGNVLSYSANGIIVYYNGVLMPTSDYTATDGSSVVFTTAVDSGGTVTIAKWALASSGGSGGGIAWGGDRGIFMAGSSNNTIDYVDITTPGNATDFGDLTTTNQGGAGTGSSVRGLHIGGLGNYNGIEYITIATTGNGTDFGDLTNSNTLYTSAAADGTYALRSGGGTTYDNTTDYVTIDTTSNASDFGDATYAVYSKAGASNSTYALFGGGAPGTSPRYDNIDYFTVASPGNASDFGNLSAGKSRLSAASDATYAFFMGGTLSTDTVVNVIDYVTVATPSNASDFGDLVSTRAYQAGSGNGSTVITGGGQTSSSNIDYFATSTPGNASNFGDLTVGRTYGIAATSGSAS